MSQQEKEKKKKKKKVQLKMAAFHQLMFDLKKI